MTVLLPVEFFFILRGAKTPGQVGRRAKFGGIPYKA
jgi:hypothetical protein